jgi:hypothetical protein
MTTRNLEQDDASNVGAVRLFTKVLTADSDAYLAAGQRFAVLLSQLCPDGCPVTLGCLEQESGTVYARDGSCAESFGSTSRRRCSCCYGNGRTRFCVLASAYSIIKSQSPNSQSVSK